MKAESFVFTTVQKPLTMFGLPPIALAAAVFAGLLGFGVCVASGAFAFALPVGALSLIAAYIPLFRLQRRNHHFINEVLAVPSFWRGRKRRVLVSGLPPISKKTARKR